VFRLGPFVHDQLKIVAFHFRQMKCRNFVQMKAKIMGLASSEMTRNVVSPYLFEISWEVANKG